jgi:arylsulfatase A-like enzyme
VNVGLPLNETTVATQLKKAGYATAAMGKWCEHVCNRLGIMQSAVLRHLGQRRMFLPAARGFDQYLGIPFSDDMGEVAACWPSPEFPDPVCHRHAPRHATRLASRMRYFSPVFTQGLVRVTVCLKATKETYHMWENYREGGFLLKQVSQQH